MGSNEEYLDKLLQSVSNESKPVVQDEKEYSEDMTDDELLASLIDMYSEELAEFKTEEIIHKEDTIPEEWPEEGETVSESEEPAVEDVFVPNHSDMMSQSDIEALLNSLQQNDNEENDNADSKFETMEGTVEEIEKEPVEEVAVQEEILETDAAMEEPRMMDVSELDKLLGEKNDDFDSFDMEEDNLLKEMGIESMSAEQIDELLNAAAASENPEKQESPVEETHEMDLNDLFGGLSFADEFDPEHNTSQDMADLLGGMLGGNDDDELAEIDKLLQKADSNETTDTTNLRNILNMDDDIGGNDLLNELLAGDSGSAEDDVKSEEKAAKPKKEKKKKEKKEKQPKQKKEGESLWKKITSILFEEDESLEDDKPAKISGGDNRISVVDVDENEDILAELMNEDMQAGKKSKKKKDKNKADKNKTKVKNADGEDNGEEAIDPKEQARLEKKKQKAEKAAAKKKAKEEKAEADKAFLKAQPSISIKRAMVAFAFAISIMVIVLVIYIFVPTAIDKANARKAFYNKDYYEAYELLQGKELNDSDTILLNKVTCILKLQRKLDAYNNYVKMDKELEALNSLVEAVNLYGESYTYAKALSIDSDVDAIYEQILIILNGKYGVSEAGAKEILACESDAEYTLRLQYVIEGKNWENVEEENSEKPMEDVLPEEEDFLEGQ